MDSERIFEKVIEKVVEKTIDKGFEYLDCLVKPPIQEIGLIFSDQIMFWRYQNQLRLSNRVRELHLKNKVVPREIPVKLFVRLIESASLEEDRVLSEMWANLLANATDASNEVVYHDVFVRVLSELSSLEVQILEFFRSRSLVLEVDYCIISAQLIDSILNQELNEKGECLVKKTKIKREASLKSKLIFDNLERLGLIHEYLDRSSGGAIKRHSISDLGRLFIKECSMNNLN
jgi:hypothetical protein